MKKEEFVKWLLPAVSNMLYTGGKVIYSSATEVHPAFLIAQAALESGWGEHIIGDYNLHGITKGSWKGKTVLCLTTEYFNIPNKTFAPPEKIKSVENVGTSYKYRVYREFRDYDSLQQAIKDHEDIFKKPGYADAWPYRKDPFEFIKKISDSQGLRYATDPNYCETLTRVMEEVCKFIPAELLPTPPKM